MAVEVRNDETLYEALVARDRAYDGFAFAAVKSTGVFCRMTCPARKPKRENTVFFDSAAACMKAGFRPCKRCRPLADGGDVDSMVRTLTDALERESDRRWREADLVERQLDPSSVRRAFKRHFSVTFLAMARLRRLGNAAEQIASGVPVIEAQVDAGFESGSGFRAAFARMLGSAPVDWRGRAVLKADWIETPIGPMIAVADDDALHLLEFADRPALDGALKRLREATRSGVALGRVAPISRIEVELADYFGGRSCVFTTPLALRGSAFSRDVWNRLREIPIGELRSYSELAAAVGRPSAVRAAARANGANPFAVVVPCHRVIGADGSLTGYGGGLWRKRWLIEHESRFVARD